MATASMSQTSDDANGSSPSTKRASRRRKTAHLKAVPETKALRELLRSKCFETAAKLDKTLPLTKDEMELVARRLLTEMEQPETYLGWIMVVLSSCFWRDQVAAVPPSRRLFLLPHCLKHAEGCPADYDEYGLECKECGACSIADFRTIADDMGYKVLVAEGSPIVLKIIVSGHVDAIVGVACLNVLEKAIDKILLAGIPCMAVPLLSSDCRNTAVDEDWVEEMIRAEQREEVVQQTRTYVHLMRGASRLFDPVEMERLVPRVRGGPRLAEVNGQGLAGLEPIAATESLAYDFLSKGGKHSRPFITLAAYDALTGGQATTREGDQQMIGFSDAVRRTAMSIETFHKASLVHDDIEDDDPYRYGDKTLHRMHGIPTAINVGDYLIGMGYRFVSREAAQLGADVVVDILDNLADAHTRLSEGQGAELVWRDAKDKRLKPIDALKIYALKTAPAFEAALFSGIRLAGSVESYAQPIKLFARNLGVAFQILNDLQDWEGDQNNKLAAGGDILSGRPTVLWALAIDSLSEEASRELCGLSESGSTSEYQLQRALQLYQQADVFEKANRLVDKHQDRAEAIADAIEPEDLRRLLYFLIDTVLERHSPDAKTEQVTLPRVFELPKVAK